MSNNPYVLVVEDDPFYFKIYQTKLAKEQIEAGLVGNGNEALEAVKKRLPGLILLDLIMPEKDGFETLAALKADPATAQIPVIILSNLSQEEYIKKVMDMGAVEYLIKANTSMQSIIDKVKHYL